MRSEEVVLVALSCIDMAHHYEETGVLDVNVGVNIDDRIVAYLYVVLAVALYRILSHINLNNQTSQRSNAMHTQVYVQHLYYLELDVEVGVGIEGWYWQNTLLVVLVGKLVFPVQNA